MPDIDRSHDPYHFHEMHIHFCENCKREWSCLCMKQPDKRNLVCRDCETATYDPALHGGRGEKREA